MKTGFIGLGIMGSRMAANLQNAGHDLIVHNRTRGKADDLVNGGATWADSPASMAKQRGVQQVNTLITMLAHPDAVHETALGDDGFLTHLPEGVLWIDCSTGHKSFTQEMARAAASHGVRFVEAPVAGSKNQAAGAQLVFFAGGESANVDGARPLLEAMGQRVVHVGEAGMGTALKLVINHMLATSMVAVAEGLALGQGLGLSRETLLDVLVGGPVTAPFVAGKREKLTSGDYGDTEFPLRWMQKDMQMVATAAYESGVGMPLASVAKEVYQLAVQRGLGDGDFAGIASFYTNE